MSIITYCESRKLKEPIELWELWQLRNIKYYYYYTYELIQVEQTRTNGTVEKPRDGRYHWNQENQWIFNRGNPGHRGTRR